MGKLVTSSTIKSSDCVMACSRIVVARGSFHKPSPLVKCRANSNTQAIETSHGFLTEMKVIERVLRYPGGQERRIRYPAHLIIEEDDSVAVTDSADSVDRDRDWWGIESYYNALSDDEDDERTSTSMAEGHHNTIDSGVQVHPGRPMPTPVTCFCDGNKRDSYFAPYLLNPFTLPKSADASLSFCCENEGFPNSPAELLSFINSDQRISAAEEQLRLVKESYRVMEHSPWLQTKALYVLATAQLGNETPMTYSLKTRVSQPDQENELSKVLGKKRADGSNLIRMEEIRDGVVAFEDESDAHRYSAMLEAEGSQAMVAECDSHTLFREVVSTRAVVVLVKECTGLQCHLPLPEELRTALKAKPSLEDSSQL